MSPRTVLSIASFVFIQVILIANCDDDCHKGFADTCFTSVTGDLVYMLNLKKMVAVNVTRATLNELCLSVDDSLNCTADIIETECSDANEVRSFEAWLKSLRATHSYMCAGYDHKVLATLLRGIECWNIEDFLFCVEGSLRVTHVRDLLHAPINGEVCRNLKNVFIKCNLDAAVGSCREQDDVSKETEGMIHAFLSSACGTEEMRHLPSQSRAPSVPFDSITLFSAFLFVKILLFM
ncbi:hypothetical protein JTE90_019526 [Oedothorax gibbosus]|uniref:Secreted protein n=1 Tax=Oedothorax gibbosus TaxID=931172 RepID=A0AAV6VHG6_9ARAC|nr:hypothetical protein JTE90_019526 [Oedothorax gibbosus]